MHEKLKHDLYVGEQKLRVAKNEGKALQREMQKLNRAERKLLRHRIRARCCHGVKFACRSFCPHGISLGVLPQILLYMSKDSMASAMLSLR